MPGALPDSRGMDPAIRKATRADNDAIAVTLATAFYDDPLFSWFFPDARTRLRKLRGFFAYCNPRMALPHDETWVNTDGTVVAVWLPPDTWKTPISEQLRVLPGFVRWAGRRTPRILRVMTEMDTAHPHDPPSWYLFVLGTAAEHQGKGLGSAAIAPDPRAVRRRRCPRLSRVVEPAEYPLLRAARVRGARRDRDRRRAPLTPMWREPR